MLVYGDTSRTLALVDGLAELDRRLAAVRDEAPGLARHAALVAAFVLAAELAQGIADAEFAVAGEDRRSPAQNAALAFLTALAGAVWASWQGGFAALPPLPTTSLLRGEETLPATVITRLAEGFAFYALYPEGSAAAAAAASNGSAATVIGIRSIGVALAAMVAAGAGAAALLTVRPVGPPFRRTLSLAPSLVAELAAAGSFAVVDEGPGLSGSSFGAVIDTLAALDVAPGRIDVFPSHRGDPGAEASAEHRDRWRAMPRHVVEFEQLLRGADNPAHRLESWVETVVGPLAAPLDDISGGAWRARRENLAAWPPADTRSERRKLLAHTGDGTFLVKFAGIGPSGEARLALARALGDAGLSPKPAGLAYGFLVERWHGEAGAADGLSRAALVAGVGRYLAFRAGLAAEPGRGASAVELLVMAERNTALALGDAAAAPLAMWRTRVAELDLMARKTVTDNRMHPWEWLALPDGSLLKSDAADHFCAHDLVGCQDIAWDLVGAEVELGLDGAEFDAVRRAVEHVRRVEPALLAFLRPCYLAFQLGAYTLAAAAHDGAEAARLSARATFYRARLKQCLGG